MSEAQLERSVLESKEREELLAIAEALGTEPAKGAKKTDLVTAILRATGVEAAPAPARRTRTRKTAAPAAEAAPTPLPSGAGNAPTGDTELQSLPGLDAPAAAAEPATGSDEGAAPDDQGADTGTLAAPEGAEASTTGDDHIDGDAGDTAADADENLALAQPGGAPEPATRRTGGEANGRADGGGGRADAPGGAPAAANGTHPDPNTATGGERPEGEGGGRRNRRRRGRDRDRGERELQGAPVEVPYSGEPIPVSGLLDLRDEGYGFVRIDGYQAAVDDVYVSISQVRRFALRRGDHIEGAARPAGNNERYPALLRIDKVSGVTPDEARERKRFDSLTPVYPDRPLPLEAGGATGRVVDVVAPLGHGTRGVIASPPRSGKNGVLADLAAAVAASHPDLHLVVLLIDERPEEVTEARRHSAGEVVAVSFDHPAEEQVQVAELVVERAKRLVEQGRDVVMLLDGITRLTRAYNLSISTGGRPPGSLDPVAIQMAKRFLGAARNTEEAGSLTVLATAAVDTGSRIDEAILDELREVVTTEIRLDHGLAERRVHPAIDVAASGTMQEDRFLGGDLDAVVALRQSLRSPDASPEADDAAQVTPVERLLEGIRSTPTNSALIAGTATAPSA